MVQKRKRKKKAPVDEINADAKKESLVKKKSEALQKVPAEREHPLKVNEENDLETEEGASCSGDHVEEDMEVEDDFHDLINSEDEEVIGENGESSKAKTMLRRMMIQVARNLKQERGQMWKILKILGTLIEES